MSLPWKLDRQRSRERQRGRGTEKECVRVRECVKQRQTQSESLGLSLKRWHIQLYMRLDACSHGWIDGGMNEWMDGYTDGYMWMDGRNDRQTDLEIGFVVTDGRFIILLVFLVEPE